MKQRYSSKREAGACPYPDTSSPSRGDRTYPAGRRILLVDDNPQVGEAISVVLKGAGHSLDIATAPAEAYSRLAQVRYDAILLDLNFSPGQSDGKEGLACLDRILRDDPSACVIVITAHSGIRIAVAAMQSGARDFVMKPWRNRELLEKISAAIAHMPATATLSPGMHSPQPMPAMMVLGDSAAMSAVRALVNQAGPSLSSVTIHGKPGTGRTLIARALHAASPLRTASIVQIDMRDPEHAMRVATTTGTILLLHVDDVAPATLMPLLDQPAIDRRFVTIVDTLRWLPPQLRPHLASVDISLPLLSEREGDAVLLAEHFIRNAARRYGLPTPALTPSAQRFVLETHWPLEVVGLKRAVERAVLLSTGDSIDVALLAPATEPAEAASYDLADKEKAVIIDALREHHHNVKRAAAALGLSRGALYRRMERHGL